MKCGSGCSCRDGVIRQIREREAEQPLKFGITDKLFFRICSECGKALLITFAK